jgi:hypothetical protein
MTVPLSSQPKPKGKKARKEGRREEEKVTTTGFSLTIFFLENFCLNLHVAYVVGWLPFWKKYKPDILVWPLRTSASYPSILPNSVLPHRSCINMYESVHV